MGKGWSNPELVFGSATEGDRPMPVSHGQAGLPGVPARRRKGVDSLPETVFSRSRCSEDRWCFVEPWNRGGGVDRALFRLHRDPGGRGEETQYPLSTPSFLRVETRMPTASSASSTIDQRVAPTSVSDSWRGATASWSSMLRLSHVRTVANLTCHPLIGYRAGEKCRVDAPEGVQFIFPGLSGFCPGRWCRIAYAGFRRQGR